MERKFVVVITEHRSLGHILLPYIVEKRTHGIFYSVKRLVRSHNVDDKEYYPCSKEEREIVAIIESYSDEVIAKKFSKSGKINDLLKGMSTEDFNKTVCPFLDKKIVECLDIIKETGIELYYKKGKYNSLYNEDVIRVNDKAEVTFQFNQISTGTQYSLFVIAGNRELPLMYSRMKFITNTPCSILIGSKLHLLKDVTYNNISPFFKKSSITIPLSVEEKYYSTFVLAAVRDRKVEGNGFQIEEIDIKPTPLIKIIDNKRSKYSLSLEFQYGSQTITSSDSCNSIVDLEAKGREYKFIRSARDLKAEKKFTKKYKSSKPPKEGSLYAIMEWLSSYRSKFEEMGYAIEENNHLEDYATDSYHLDISGGVEGDWFDLLATVKIGDITLPFTYFKEAITKDIREWELPNGKIFVLPEEWFARYKDLLSIATIKGNSISISKIHYGVLDETVKIDIDSEIVPIDHTLATPSSTHATLREYQLDGFRWMYHLNQNRFGGCLADDMGLGKTIQTITLLQKIKEDAKEEIEKGSGEPLSASLIVLPTSLVHNWKSELEKFAPELTVFAYVGSQRQSVMDLATAIKRYDIIITTYGTLRNDISLIEERQFHYVILDEGQNIKNRSSQIFKAILKVDSLYRLILTGTPIENSLADLWSQLHFLNRGSLGSFEWFKREFIIPIEKKGDEDQSKKLLRYISSFILRRTKEEVAKDLPPITEQVRVVPMSESQRAIYESEKSSVRNSIMEGIVTSQKERNPVMILQGLTKLRQVANHPRLLNRDALEESGKFTEINRMLDVLHSEGHKILIFSSFVSHLNLFKERFEEKNLPYSILTGSSNNRAGIIDEFRENPDIKLFLISLKAGGVGLNLTEADYVFILDPWWNPAAEAQAINRAHRIGQTKSVFVYKFITEDSIEEKIHKLKSRKSELSKKFITAENSFSSLSESELRLLLD